MISRFNRLLCPGAATRSLARLVTRLCVPVTIAVFALAFTARADMIYNINDTVGFGTVSGTITTNGTLGILVTADIIDWNLSLNNGFGTTLNLTGPSAITPIEGVEVLGNSLTASSTNLSYDFGGTGFFLIQENGLGNGGTYFCEAGFSQATCFAGGESDFPGFAFSADQQFEAHAGDVSIGTASTLSTSPTPEPSSVFLLFTAILGLGLLARKRFGREQHRGPQTDC